MSTLLRHPVGTATFTVPPAARLVSPASVDEGATRFDAASEDYSVALADGSRTARTIAFWFRKEAGTAAFATPITLQSAAGTDFDIIQLGTGAATMDYWKSAVGSAAIGAVAAGTWYFCAVSVSGASGTAYLRALGAGSWTTVAVSSGATDVNTLRIARSPTGDAFVGSVCGVKLWYAALTETDLDAEYTQKLPVRLTDLTAAYALEAPSTADDSGNGNTLTLTGGTPTITDGPDGVPLGTLGAGTTHAAAGDALSTSTAAGTLTLTGALTGAAASVSTATGGLTALLVLSGAASSVTTAAGALTRVTPLAGAAASVSSAAGAVGLVTAVSGAAASTSTAAGVLVYRLGVSGTAASVTTAAGSLTRITPISGTATSTSSAAGAVDIFTGPITWAVAGTASSTSTAGGALTAAAAVAGTASSTSTAAGAVTLRAALTGTATSTATAAATLTLRGILTGASLSFSTATGEVGLRYTITGASVSVTLSAGTIAFYIAQPPPTAGIDGTATASTIGGSSTAPTVEGSATGGPSPDVGTGRGTSVDVAYATASTMG